MLLVADEDVRAEVAGPDRRVRSEDVELRVVDLDVADGDVVDEAEVRAASGIVTESAASPVMALALRICLAVAAVGNVSGAQNENTMTIAIQM